MPQSPNERLNVVERVISAYDCRLDIYTKEVYAIRDVLRALEKEHADLKQTSERELALLQREIDELKKRREDVKRREQEWGSRLWMILPPVLAVFVSNAITYLSRRLREKMI